MAYWIYATEWHNHMAYKNMPMEELSSTEIRSIRGDRTRAAFAELVGVNAHTVYRWELPAGSAHARRPRGADLAKLRSLAAKLPDPHLVAIIAAVERTLEGRWREAENVLMRAQAARNAGIQVRALAATGLAMIDLFHRADGRRALVALAPALASDAPASALTEATAALAYSMPDGELFDLERVNAHARRADELSRPGETPLPQALAAMAVANAALLAGDDDLMLRALGRVEAVSGASLPVVPGLFLEQLRSYASALAGQTELALVRLDRILANPHIKESASLESRTLAAWALRSLDNLGDPEHALAIARQAREVARANGLAMGVHMALALRAEADALMRLGRMSELVAVFAESDRVLDELAFPVTVILPAQARYLWYTNQPDALDVLAAKVAAIELPSMRAICQAYAAWLRATALFTRGEDSAATLAAFSHAEQLASGWSLLRRDILMGFTSAAHIEGTISDARAVLGRAQRAADRRPSAWVTAHLRRAEGFVMIGEGRVAEGFTMIDAAIATFVASGDLLGTAFAHYGAAGFARIAGAADAEARVAASQAELAALALQPPRWIDRALARNANFLESVNWQRQEHVPATLTQGLELGLQRVAVAGASVTMVVKELVSVACELTRGPVTVTDETGTNLHSPAVTFEGEVITWFELGAGRRARLGVTRVLDGNEQGAMRVLVLVAGLALQIAELRGGDPSSRLSELVVPDVPGLVVASAAMRRLIADVGRLAGSRATVAITGESGAGKELIARTLHDLSQRAPKPYVVFNCAAVPHDLFEGLLFGYRKGAFTGAVHDHTGVIRAADGGTLFLDEIGELPLDIQPKLLRFLDAGEVFPLGAERPVTVDVRVIAATNRDLAAEVARGAFRQDLFYRLHVVPLVVPPLRERRDDIVPLARHFMRLLGGDRASPTFAPDALAAMRDHAWPGNARELRNVIERALAYADGPNSVLTRSQLGI
jgi:DNA-binding transcriptional regulator YiaG